MEAARQDPVALSIIVASASGLATVLVFVAREILHGQRTRRSATRGLLLFGEIVCRALEHEQQPEAAFEMKTAVECAREVDREDAAELLRLLDLYRLRVASSAPRRYRIDATERQQMRAELERALSKLKRGGEQETGLVASGYAWRAFM